MKGLFSAAAYVDAADKVSFKYGSDIQSQSD